MPTHNRDKDDGVVSHFRAADVGVTLIWRWATMLVTLIGFGIIIGGGNAKFNSMDTAITDLKSDIADFKRTASTQAIQIDRNTISILTVSKTQDQLTSEIKELRAQLDMMRNMREAYVYASAAKKQQKTGEPTPP